MGSQSQLTFSPSLLTYMGFLVLLLTSSLCTSIACSPSFTSPLLHLHLHLLSPACLSVSHAMCSLGSRTWYLNCVFRLWKSEEVLSCEPWNSGDRLPTLSLFSLILALHCRSQKAHQTFSGLSTRESHLKCEAFKALWIYISICQVNNEYLTWYHGQTLVKSIQRINHYGHKRERETIHP